jgi:hypothetical protein
LKPLIPQHVLWNVQQIAERGMQTSVTIRSRSVARKGSTVSAGDYGDDVVVYTETHETEEHGVMGWFNSTPTPVQELDAGSLVTVNTYRLYLPVGTVVTDGDEVAVGDEEYIVSDTTGESTWLAMLVCSLRKRD